MQQAKLTFHEFFYDTSFYDYKIHSSIPYKVSNTLQYSSLVKDLSAFDLGDGVFYDHEHILRQFPNLNAYKEFKNCNLHIINTPIFKVSYISNLTLDVESELLPVNVYESTYDVNFTGESFEFIGDFYLFSIQMYQDNLKYYMRIRGYENVKYPKIEKNF